MKQQPPIILVTRVFKYYDTDKDQKEDTDNYQYDTATKMLLLEHVSSCENFYNFDDYNTECCMITLKCGTEFIIEGNVHEFYKLLKNYYKSKNSIIFANNN